MPTALPRPWPSGPVVVSTPGGVPVLGVARGQRAPLPQRLEVVELQAVPGQVELDVEGQAGVAARRARTGPGPASAGRSGRAACTRWNSRYAAGARLIAVPGWPLPAFSTASMASTRTSVDRPAVQVGPVLRVRRRARGRGCLRRRSRAPARRARRRRGRGPAARNCRSRGIAPLRTGRALPARVVVGLVLRAAEPRTDHCERSPAPPDAPPRGRTVARSSSAGRPPARHVPRQAGVRHGGAYSARVTQVLPEARGSDRRVHECRRCRFAIDVPAEPRPRAAVAGWRCCAPTWR